MSVCGSSGKKQGCGAEILWCVTDKNHKAIPLDPEPQRDGVWIKVRLEGDDKIVHRLTTAELEAPRDNKARYRSHWETCIYSKDFHK